ncbi:MAG TPA: ATP-binding protein [Ferrovibrio sp.]|uniref:ATP-binding protein n=1 Tax=Ferrovibrio sp. TaxID=1917215 RepID=UPI002ED420C6
MDGGSLRVIVDRQHSSPGLAQPEAGGDAKHSAPRRSIAIKQVKVTVVTALILGVIFSLLQLLLDIRSELGQRQVTVTQVMDMLNEPASEAAYALDEQLAARVVKGLLLYRPIWRAEIYDNYGRRMAALEQPHDSDAPEWLKSLLPVSDELLVRPLYAQRNHELVGEMRVSVDGSLLARSILNRAWVVLGTGLVRNFLLALVLAVLFYFTLTRPLLALISQIAQADPRDPKPVPITVPAQHGNDELGLLASKVNAILTVGTDHLAARNREVEQREISERRFRDFANAASDWFWERDAALKLTHSSFSGPYSPLLAYEQMLQDERGYGDAAWVAHREALAARRAFRDFRFRVAAPDGCDCCYSISGVPVFDAAGDFQGYRGAGSDITSQVAAEAEVERSRELLNTVLEAIPAPVSVKDTEGRYVLINHGLAETFRARPEEIIGKHISELPLDGLAPECHADVIALSNTLEAEALRTGRPLLNRERSYRLASGMLRTVLESKVPLKDAQGKIIAVLSISLDISERKVSEQALDEANARLRRQSADLERLAASYAREREHAIAANRAKSEFLANMSHELRTPLNAIIGFAEVIALRMWGDRSEKYFDYAQDIGVSARHLLNVINDILDMSKIEAGRYELALEANRLPGLVQDCLTIVKGRAQEARLMLANDVADDLPAIRVDARAIKQVLLNLLSNAIKFTPAGGQVRIGGRRDADGSMVIQVSDTGIGIPPEFLPRIFEPFWQGDPNIRRDGEGTGLGLAISRKFVELHGGSLVLESRENAGTTATIRLPSELVEAS